MAATQPADPLTCCLQDYASNHTPFTSLTPGSAIDLDSLRAAGLSLQQNNLTTYTCDEKYRDALSPSCKLLLTPYCSLPGNFLSDSRCLGYISKLSYSTYDPQNAKLPGPAYPDLQTLSSKPFAGTFAEAQSVIGNVITSVERPWNNDPYQILNFCAANPLLCSGGLTSICSTITNDDILNNPKIADYCGCYLQSSEYATYDNMGLEVRCTPQCLQAKLRIQNIDKTFQTCNTTTCIIDNLSILGQNVAEGININQTCNHCENGQCNCIISDNIITLAPDAVKVQINQQCGGGVSDNLSPQLKNTDQSSTLTLVFVGALFVLVAVYIFTSFGKDESGRSEGETATTGVQNATFTGGTGQFPPSSFGTEQFAFPVSTTTNFAGGYER